MTRSELESQEHYSNYCPSSETKDKHHVCGGKIKPMDLVTVLRVIGAARNPPYPRVVVLHVNTARLSTDSSSVNAGWSGMGDCSSVKITSKLEGAVRTPGERW